jgi:hypothetical protein
MAWKEYKSTSAIKHSRLDIVVGGLPEGHEAKAEYKDMKDRLAVLEAFEKELKNRATLDARTIKVLGIVFGLLVAVAILSKL